ncbi:MAG: chromate transporter [Lachnospiraceae bacterium]|nr:chromate transporter [Lachnospiraceae bacterium]
MNKLGSLLVSMLKVGCIGFGGGNALVPVIEKEVVKEHKLVTQKQFNKFILTANITPGALPVEIAIALGKEVAGPIGMILSALCIAMPGVLATLLLIIVFSRFSGEAITQVKFASVGISIYIMYLLFMYNKKIWDQYKLTSMKLKRLAITLLIVFLTFGSEIYKIFGINRTPIFDISTVDVLLLSFFLIFSTGKKMTKQMFVFDGIVSLLYVLCVGKAQVISNRYVLYALYVIMVVVSIYGIRKSFEGEKIKKRASFKKVVKEEVSLVIFMVVGGIAAVITSAGSLLYLAKGYLSSIISFGGGEAYLTVAQSLFEDVEILDHQLYSQLLPVVNALPGSILTKMLAGIGYYQGLNATGSVAIGVLVALAGFFVAIAASGAVLCAVMYIYDMFEKLTIFELLGKCIKPIVGGLLISTGLGLFCQMQDILLKGCNLQLHIVLIFTAIMVVVILLLKKLKKIPDFAIILLCGAISMVVCNLIAR